MQRQSEIALGLVLGTFAVIGSIFFIIANNAVAQVNPTDRFFQKDFCANEDALLADIVYLTGGELSYDSTGCPVSLKIIHNWDNLSTANQIIITARMNTNGYQDVTENQESVIGRQN